MGGYMRKVFAFVLTTLLLTSTLLAPGCKKGDDSPTSPDEAAVTQLKANGAIAPVSRTQVQGTVFVSDQTGNPVTGLASTNFSARLRFGAGVSKITADSISGVVTIQTVSASGKKVAVGMTMDYSGSMFAGDTVVGGKYKRISDMESGVKTFFNALKTGDLGEVIKFGSTVDYIFPFTGDKTRLCRAVDSLCDSRGNTALYSSMYRALQDAGAQSASSYARAVVAFTDGGENNSTETRSQVITLAKQLGIPIYTIGLLDASYHSTPPGQYSSAEKDLVEFADTTGGFYFYAPAAAQLSTIYTQISGQLSNAVQITIVWPSTGLPASGTTVQAVVTVTYSGCTTTFTKTYVMP
jgi:hypothetical protein